MALPCSPSHSHTDSLSTHISHNLATTASHHSFSSILTAEGNIINLIKYMIEQRVDIMPAPFNIDSVAQTT